LLAARNQIEKEAWTTIMGWFYWAEGMIASHQGDLERSIQAYEQAARLARQFGQRWYLGRALVEQADVYLSRHQGNDIDQANQLLEEARQIFRDLAVPYYEQIAAQIM
jgi:tetratricopeptide (TPR) repeat protein